MAIDRRKNYDSPFKERAKIVTLDEYFFFDPDNSRRVARKYGDDVFIVDKYMRYYILGILFGTGSISKNQYYSEIVISSGDYLLLGYIARCFNLRNKYIHRYKGTKKSYRLRIPSVQLISDLEKLGLTEKKGLTLAYPNYIDDLEAERSFLRGLFDIRGRLINDNGRRIISSFQFTNYRFIQSLRDRLTELLNLKDVNILERGQNSFLIRYYVNDTKALITFLYEGSPFCSDNHIETIREMDILENPLYDLELRRKGVTKLRA